MSSSREWSKAGIVCRLQTITAPAKASTRARIPKRRCQLVMPRSSNIVRANDEPSVWRLRVEKISHQPAA